MFISELFEGKGDVPANPKQKQGPAGQFRGTDKAPARNKLVGEATGLKKRVKIVKGPAAGRTGYVGEVHHGQFKGAPKQFVIDLDGGGNIMCSKDQLRLIKDDMGEAMEREPQYADPDFAKPMFEFGDSTGLKPGALANHGLLGNVKILSVKGHHAEVCSVRGGKHYHVELSSLRTGHLDEDTNPQDEITMDVPLLIRLLEYAKEDAKTDMDLHNVAERLIKLSGQGCLSMDQYDAIVGGVKEMAPGREAYAGRMRVPGFNSNR